MSVTGKLASAGAAVLAAISFAMTLILIAAGRSPGQMAGFYLLSANTSHLAQPLIEFSVIDSLKTVKRDQADGSDLGLDDTAFSSATKVDGLLDDAEALLPGSNTTLGDVMGLIAVTVTQQVDGGLTAVENALVKTVLKHYGVHDSYSIYMGGVCMGNMPETNKSDAEDVAVADVKACRHWSNHIAGFVNSSATIPSSATVLTINATVPLLQTINSSGNISGTLHVVVGLIFTMQIVALLGTGCVLLGSLASVPFGHTRIVTYVNMGGAFFGVLGQGVTVLVVTVVGSIVPAIIQPYGDAVELYITPGGKALLVAWVGLVLTALVLLYWLAVWFVVTRTVAIKLRTRAPEEKGDWRGIAREVRYGVRPERLARAGA